MTNIITNTKVNTPIGMGWVNGFTNKDPLTCIVQVPINDENRAHLADANCWTPKATHLALFEYKESELTVIHERTSTKR